MLIGRKVRKNERIDFTAGLEEAKDILDRQRIKNY